MTHRLMHKHVGRHAQMHKSKESQTCGTKQARQAYQHHTKWRKVCIMHTNTMEVYLTSGYIQTNPREKQCNHTKQVALRTDKHKPTEGIKHGKSKI